MKAVSGEDLDLVTDEKSLLFWGFKCILREAVKTKPPTEEIKPAKKELKGKVPTITQYKNWIIPVNMW